MAKSGRDSLQVAAFKSFYKFSSYREPEERFTEALIKSSDIEFERIQKDPKRKKLLKLWIQNFYEERSRRKRKVD